ncbi:MULTISPECIES: IclR family transcriptional regulator [unclassified Caballeronia]|uniref:IclR family transcriptional regulator n=1 Tax=unclassified Caballeronia TaxID=2646786 RepID=UPI00285AB055|nr:MULTISPECIES: IclR family transcriptional regulator [unclassified Caballeronia]MDR5752389.1 IclR family transcriptional regulator [Caballeronia sp. LZ024]MDR5845194.1 IclR family transcriptional regulator [Caballeronia sp. LZ031]
MTTTDSTTITLTVERGLEVLRAFRAERVSLSNADLVRRTGLSKATVSRITTTLIRIGFLRRVTGGPRFELSTGALSIGHAYLEANAMARIVNPFLQKLADKLGLSVALAVPDHLDMLYIAYRSSAKIATLRLGVGTLLPMESTSVGRAYLYALPESERRKLIKAILASPGKDTDLVRQGLETAFADLGSSGVCMAVGEYQRNAYGIALPLRLGRAKTLMALNCGAVEMEPDMTAIRKRAIPQLQAAASALSDLLADVDCEK